MNKRMKNLILLIVIAQIVLIVGLLALPPIVEAIPGRYRVALSERSPFLGEIAEGVFEQVAPVATALPAPVAAAGTESQIDISALLATRATATPTTAVATATPTAMPTAVEETTATAAPTATPTAEPTATPTSEPLPTQMRLEGLSAIRQSFNNCGPANLTQVLNFYGDDITQADVAAYLKPNAEDRNVSPWQIADFVNEQTAYRAIARSGGTLQMIKEFVAAGFPVVVEKGYEPNTERAQGWWGHYLTVFGYDDELEEFYSMDSYLGPFDNSGRTDSYEDIEYFWQHFNYTFYIVYDPADEKEVYEILGPEMLDDFTMWQNVAARAEQETKTNPDDSFAWFNLGTALTRLGELTGENEYYQGGAQAFDRAREIGLAPRMLWYQFRPYLAYMKVGRYQDIVDLADATLDTQGGRNVEETYLYKGHALAFLGDGPGAVAAYEQALEVNENFYPAQWALDSIINPDGG